MRKKFFLTTTIPLSLGFFKGNLSFLSNFYDICAISSDSRKLSDFGKSERIRTYCIPMRRNISILFDFICLLQFIFLFISKRPYIVHGNTPKASLLSMIAGWITRVPVRIYMCHGLRYQGAQGKVRKLLMFLEKISCICASEVICVSDGVRKTLVNDKICNDKKAIVVGYGSASGIDLSYFSPDIKCNINIRQLLNIQNDSFVFIFIGRVVADKGINELVNAFSRLSKEHLNIDLILVGPEERDLNPISKEVSKEIILNKHIHAVGSQTDIRPYLLAADTMVFPSYREGFGMVLIEAASMNVPAISSDIIGCNEIILDGVNGKLIPPKDIDALYSEMKWFYEHKDTDVKMMKSNARKMIESRYEQKKVWNLLLAEYQRLENK